jgi:hypothetical protein
MRRLICVLVFLVASAFVIPPAFADPTSLQSILVNENNAVQFTDFTGANTAGFNTTTGLGTLIYDYNPGPGVYFFDVFFDHSLNLPFFNEFGTVLGAPAAGQSYEIGDSFASSIYPDVQAGGSLSNTNTLPGQATNYHNNCVGANCNGDFAAAMGFSFTLGANEMAEITFNVSHTDPGSGLRLKDTHPLDPANPVALQLFINGSEANVPVNGNPSPVPEPSSVFLLTSVGGPMLWRLRRRLSKRSDA